MNLFRSYQAIKSAKSYGGTGRGMGGAAYSDIQNKGRSPTALTLLRELVGIAYACADINANSIAATTCRLYMRKPKGAKTKYAVKSVERWNGVGSRKTPASALASNVGDDTDIVEVTDHPMLDVLAHPESGPLALSHHDHVYTTQLSLECLGTAYWHVERDGLGIPNGFTLLPLQRVLPVWDYGTGELTGYTFDRKPVPVEDMIRFHNPDLSEPHWKACSPMMSVFEQIEITRRFDAQTVAVLENSARPDAIWSPKGDSEGGGIGEYEARRVRSAMRQAFSEAGKGGLLVSEYPGTLQVLGWKPGDIVEIQRAAAIKTSILNAFGVPDSMMDLNESNLASAKAAEAQYANRALLPRCSRYGDTLNMHVVPLFDPPKGKTPSPLFFAFDSTVPDDEVFELETAKVAGQIGLVTVDEGRATVNLAPIGGKAGSMRYINGAPLDENGMPIVSAAAPPPKPGINAVNSPPKPKSRVPEQIPRARTKSEIFHANIHQSRNGHAGRHNRLSRVFGVG